MLGTVHNDWAEVLRAAAVAIRRRIAEAPDPTEEPTEEPDMEQCRLDYVRRYGAVMGMRMHKIDGSRLP